MTLDHEPLTGFVSSKVQAMLCYIVMHTEPVSRNELASMFWGEMPDADAKNNLRQAFTNLRKVAGSHIKIERDHVCMNPEHRFVLDVVMFESCLTATDAPERWLEGVDLCRGDFMEGVYVREAPQFEEWLTLQREHFRGRLLMALRALAHEEAQHGPEGRARAIAHLRRAIALDAWNEEAHRFLMLLLARNGQRSAAIAQYVACCGVLQREFGIEPTRETTALYERLNAAAMVPRHNLVPSTSSFVGREAEVAAIVRELESPNTRLLTVTGPGGMGKTRIAAIVAEQLVNTFVNGAFVVSLAGVDEPDLIIPAVVSAVGLVVSQSANAWGDLLSYLREKELLLVLDSVEHLVAPVLPARRESEFHANKLISDILLNAPYVKVLITSRERIGVVGEKLVALDGLSVPPVDAPTHQIARYEAVKLFVERAQEQNISLETSDMPDVGRICHFMQGMPLGIELAAGWVSTLACSAIVRELESGLDFVSTSARAAKRKDLRAVFQKSWDRLSPQERMVFAKLTIFRGGFTLEAAQHVAEATPSTLKALIDTSFVQRHSSDRFQIHEVLRYYGGATLREQGGVYLATCQRHCDYFCEFLQRREPALWCGEQVDAAKRIVYDIDNVWEACNWAVLHQQTIRLSGSLAALARFCTMRGLLREGLNLFERACASLNVRSEPQLHARQMQARMQAQQASWCYTLARYGECGQLLDACIPTLREDGPSIHLILALNTLSILRSEQSSNHTDAKAPAKEALLLAQHLDFKPGVAHSLVTLGSIAWAYGDYSQAITLSEQSLDVASQAGDARSSADSLSLLSASLLYLGDYAQTRELTNQLADVFLTLEDKHGIGKAEYRLGILDYTLREYISARKHFDHALGLQRALGDVSGIVYSLNGLAMVSLAHGDYPTCIRLAREAIDVGKHAGEWTAIVHCLHTLGDGLVGEGRLADAKASFREGLHIGVRVDFVPGCLLVLLGWAGLLVRQPDPDFVLSVTILYVILDNPGAIKEVHDRARQLMTDLASRVAPATLGQAQYIASDMSWRQLAMKLLNEAPIP